LYLKYFAITIQYKITMLNTSYLGAWLSYNHSSVLRIISTGANYTMRPDTSNKATRSVENVFKTSIRVKFHTVQLKSYRIVIRSLGIIYCDACMRRISNRQVSYPRLLSFAIRPCSLYTVHTYIKC
jgi:hypothetical protein